MRSNDSSTFMGRREQHLRKSLVGCCHRVLLLIVLLIAVMGLIATDFAVPTAALLARSGPLASNGSDNNYGYDGISSSAAGQQINAIGLAVRPDTRSNAASSFDYDLPPSSTTPPPTVATETGGKSKGKWVSPEDAADADAKEIADSHRGDPSYESGRHGEGPRETARDIGELIKESEKAGKLPEYIERLKEIQKTFQDRARAGHPGGRR